MSASTELRAARDLLLTHRTDVVAATTAFRWPDVGPSFNWATDWFDVIAEGSDRIALWIVDEDGTDTRVTFDEMRRRSDRVAAWLAEQGVGQGDHVLLMLGNRVELWESMLAIMKLGAVILPTTTLLSDADLQDRLDRGGVRHVIADAADADKFDEPDGRLPSDRRWGARWRDGRTSGPRARSRPRSTARRCPQHRSVPHLLHLWHDQQAEDGRAHSRVLSGRPPDDHVLARCAARRCAHDHQLARLGASTRGAASSDRGTPRRRCSCSTTRASTPPPSALGSTTPA